MPPKKHEHLTPEEKKERKKQKKLEKKLKKAEKKRQVKRDYLAREVNYGEITTRKYEKSWKEMLTKIALPRMRAELEFAWSNFERSIDCKDFTISLIMDELKMCEDQYMRNFKTHCENMEKLIRFLKERLDELKEEFDQEVTDLEERWGEEYQGINGVENENLEYMKTMLHQLELEKREQIRIKRNEYYSRLDEANVKNTHLLQNLKMLLENKYQGVFDNLNSFILSFQKQIRERKKQHNLLKDQDNSIQTLISSQLHQMTNLYETLRHLKQKYVDINQTEGARLDDLLVERQYFSKCFLALKAKLETDKKNDFRQLAILSQESALAISHLTILLNLGEKILKLAAVCRKLETEREKNLPFPRKKRSEKHTYEDTEIAEGVTPEMELFWQRVGQVFGIHYSLKREKQCLKEENQVLTDTHNDYCEILLFPEIKNYKVRVTIPKTDLGGEVQKYHQYSK